MGFPALNSPNLGSRKRVKPSQGARSSCAGRFNDCTGRPEPRGVPALRLQGMDSLVSAVEPYPIHPLLNTGTQSATRGGYEQQR